MLCKHATSILPVSCAQALGAVDHVSLDMDPYPSWVVGRTYQLYTDAPDRLLSLVYNDLPPFVVAEPAAQEKLGAAASVGTVGADLYPDTCLTFCSDQGDQAQLLTLTEVDRAGGLAATYLLFLNSFSPGRPYRLIKQDDACGLTAFEQATRLGFVAGTRLTLATGAQVAVENLRPGDRILTRDAGPRAVQTVARAQTCGTGQAAPVLIRAGTLNAARNLYLLPNHRVFVYQRDDVLGLGRREILIRARDLEHGMALQRAPQKTVDAIYLGLDGHHVVFAEGIAVETARAPDTVDVADGRAGLSALDPLELPTDLVTEWIRCFDSRRCHVSDPPLSTSNLERRN